jgi:hypothetical protein
MEREEHRSSRKERVQYGQKVNSQDVSEEFQHRGIAKSKIIAVLQVQKETSTNQTKSLKSPGRDVTFVCSCSCKIIPCTG